MKFKGTLTHITALLVIIIWGTTFVSTKILLTAGLTPESIFFYRFLLGYLGILCFSIKTAIFANKFKDEMKFILMGVFGGSFYYYTENLALKMTYVSNVSLIVSTTPLITILLIHLFVKHEKIGKNLIFGSLLALLGVVLVIYNGHFIIKFNVMGEMLAIIAAISWSLYTLLLRNDDKKYSSLFVTRKILFYGMVTIIPMFLKTPLNTNINVLREPIVWGNLLYLGIGASLVCYLLWNLTVNSLGAIRASNYIFIIPLVTLITSAIIIEEKITAIALVGASLILSGVFLSQKEKFHRNVKYKSDENMKRHILSSSIVKYFRSIF